jgi:integrase
MPLTDIAIRNAKPKEKSYKLSDFAGLYLEVTTTGSKLWRLKYRINGKEKRLALGSYPMVTLAEAREERDAARKLIAKGKDPVQVRLAQKRQAQLENENNFAFIANEWFEYASPRWAETTQYKAKLYLQNDLLPHLGHRPVTEITRPELVDVVRKVEKRGTLNAAQKIRQWLNHIFRYALAKGVTNNNPASDLHFIAAPVPRAKHHPYLPLEEMPAFLRELQNYQGHPLTQYAVRLLMLTAVRPGELRLARWEEFDLKQALWIVPQERMKMRRPHSVPLPSQAIGILRKIEAITGRYELVFAGRVDRQRPMSENTINKCFADMGYKGRLTGHGFRHLLSTELNGHGYNKDWIERQLAHGDPDAIRGTYNHASYLNQRREMMQWWADHLEKLETGNNVVPVQFGGVQSY